MCIDTILKGVCAVEWDIIPVKGMEDQADEEEIAHIKNFFENPNTNRESFEDVFIKMPVRDILEINTGVLNKVYSLSQNMVEIVARDAATFTKSPDIHGMFTDRVDILTPKHITTNPNEVINAFRDIPTHLVTEQAAYYQYGWIAGPVPVPFGKREIIWLQSMRRTDDHYGYSAVQLLEKSLQMLVYHVESDLEYFNNNNIPKGIIGLDGGDADDIKSFKEQWTAMQIKKDEVGNYKKMMHRVPILSYSPKFERIEFSSNEMQLIEKQKWYTKMVWACFGVTSTELGYTEDAKGSANQIVQSKVFKKKAINPLLRMLETRYNSDIISEFEYIGHIKTKKGKRIEVPKYQFKFKTFDVDEERNKYELYKLQTESGIRTINEVRNDEGLEEVEWGDKAPREWQQSENNNFFGNNTDNPDLNDSDGSKKDKKPKDYDDKERDAQDTKLRTKEPGINQNKKKTEEKAAVKENPLILKENEKPHSYKRLETSINYVLDLNKDKIIDLVEDELRESQIANIKANTQ